MELFQVMEMLWGSPKELGNLNCDSGYTTAYIFQNSNCILQVGKFWCRSIITRNYALSCIGKGELSVHTKVI